MKNVRDFFEAYAKASSGDNPHSIAAFYAQDLWLPVRKAL